MEADTDLLLGFGSGGTGYNIDGLLLRGDTYEVELVSRGGPAGGSLLVYRPE